MILEPDDGPTRAKIRTALTDLKIGKAETTKTSSRSPTSTSRLTTSRAN